MGGLACIIVRTGVMRVLIDTHVHLNNPKLHGRLDEVIENARKVGVEAMIVVGYDRATNHKALSIAHEHSCIYATVGIHPTDAQKTTDADLKALEKLLDDPRVVAVGECGLDYYWDKEHKDDQKRVFEHQIRLAKARDLPVVVHMRDATEDTYETLKKHAPLKGVMHCYSGSAEMAMRFVDLGLYISLGGPVTFLNAKTPKEVAKLVPLEKLLIETDAPYLSPHPFRGKTNEPARVKLVAESLADLKSLPLDTVAQATTKNARALFGLKET